MTKDGRRGARFSVASGYGEKVVFSSVLCFDNKSLEEGQVPSRVDHGATYLLYHANKGTRVSFDARVQGEFRESQAAAGWRKGATSSRQYVGEVNIPVGFVEIHEHTGERGLLTALRRNMEDPTDKAAIEFLTSEEVKERNGNAAVLPPIWEQLSEVENMFSRPETPTTESSESISDDSDTDEDIPF